MPRARVRPDAQALEEITQPPALAKAPRVDPVELAAGHRPATTGRAVRGAGSTGGGAVRAVSVPMDAGDFARAQAAWQNTPAHLRARSWKEFVVEAILAATQATEDQYNDGQPWPSVPALRPRRPVTR